MANKKKDRPVVDAYLGAVDKAEDIGKAVVGKVQPGFNKVVQGALDLTPIDEAAGYVVDKGLEGLAKGFLNPLAKAYYRRQQRKRQRERDDEKKEDTIVRAAKGGAVARKRKSAVVRKRKGGPVGVGCAKRGYGKALPKRRVRT